MFLEELFGSCVALVSSLIIQTPPISRENLQREYTLISAPNPEQNEVYDGLIHREYEQEAPIEVPYYEDGTFVLKQADTRRNFFESFIRSLKANVGLITALVFILSSLTVGVVYVNLACEPCIEWWDKNVSVPAHVKTLRTVGMSIKLLPLFSWFPACIAMLWGFREFKKNYFACLFFCAFVPGSITCVYRIIMFDKFTKVAYNPYRLPANFLFLFSVICGAYLVARKFKKVNPAKTSYSVFRIFFMLSFVFLGSCLFAYVYTFIIIKYFRETEGKKKKAIIAALTPGIIFPLTAIVKYLILRKSSEIITSDRAFVLCYFMRGASIVLYRTMQSGFQDIWLFIGLSLLHGVSNVLSKATLNLRIKLWTFLVKCLNRICCGPRLEVQTLNSPRIRRVNADLEIQNILFEYTTVILSQAYLACYLVTSYDVPSWQIIRASLIRVAISLGIDFAFNMMSVFIQIHFYDIPMQKIWMKYWGRHVIANAIMIVIFVAYFGTVLIRVFADNNTLKEYKLRNCTTIF